MFLAFNPNISDRSRSLVYWILAVKFKCRASILNQITRKAGEWFLSARCADCELWSCDPASGERNRLDIGANQWHKSNPLTAVTREPYLDGYIYVWEEREKVRRKGRVSLFHVVASFSHRNPNVVVVVAIVVLNSEHLKGPPLKMLWPNSHQNRWCSCRDQS